MTKLTPLTASQIVEVIGHLKTAQRVFIRELFTCRYKRNGQTMKMDKFWKKSSTICCSYEYVPSSLYIYHNLSDTYYVSLTFVHNL